MLPGTHTLVKVRILRLCFDRPTIRVGTNPAKHYYVSCTVPYPLTKQFIVLRYNFTDIFNLSLFV